MVIAVIWNQRNIVDVLFRIPEATNVWKEMLVVKGTYLL